MITVVRNNEVESGEKMRKGWGISRFLSVKSEVVNAKGISYTYLFR